MAIKVNKVKLKQESPHNYSKIIMNNIIWSAVKLVNQRWFLIKSVPEFTAQEFNTTVSVVNQDTT